MDTKRQSGGSGNSELVNIIKNNGKFKVTAPSRKGQRVYLPIEHDRFVGPMLVVDHKTRLLRCPESGSQFHYLGRVYTWQS